MARYLAGGPGNAEWEVFREAYAEWVRTVDELMRAWPEPNSRREPLVKQWKRDLDGDGAPETVILSFRRGASALGMSLKVYHRKCGLVFRADCGDYTDVVFCDIDPSSQGEEIAVARYRAIGDEAHLAPHNYDVAVFGWDTSEGRYVEYAEWSSRRKYDPCAQHYDLMEEFHAWWESVGPRIAELRSRPHLGIEEAVRLYLISHNEYTESDLLRFDGKEVLDCWGTVNSVYVDEEGRELCEWVAYLLRKGAKGWRVVYWCDERYITREETRALGIPLDVLKKLGWELSD